MPEKRTGNTHTVSPADVVVRRSSKSRAVMSLYRCSVSTGKYPSALANAPAVYDLPSPRSPRRHRSLPAGDTTGGCQENIPLGVHWLFGQLFAYRRIQREGVSRISLWGCTGCLGTSSCRLKRSTEGKVVPSQNLAMRVSYLPRKYGKCKGHSVHPKVQSLCSANHTTPHHQNCHTRRLDVSDRVGTRIYDGAGAE